MCFYVRHERLRRDIDVTFLDFLTCHAMSSKDLRQMSRHVIKDVILPRNSTKFGSWRAIVTLQRYVELRLLPTCKSIPVYYNFTTLFAAFRKTRNRVKVACAFA